MEPVATPYVPAAQEVHSGDPLEVWYWPAGQFVQAVALACENVPSLHAAHDVEGEVAEK